MVPRQQTGMTRVTDMSHDPVPRRGNDRDQDKIPRAGTGMSSERLMGLKDILFAQTATRRRDLVGKSHEASPEKARSDEHRGQGI